MLSQAIAEKLNEQINLEFYSSNVYLQMSAWCAHHGYEGAAAFLYAMPMKKWNICKNYSITSVKPVACLYLAKLKPRKMITKH